MTLLPGSVLSGTRNPTPYHTYRNRTLLQPEPEQVIINYYEQVYRGVFSARPEQPYDPNMFEQFVSDSCIVRNWNLGGRGGFSVTVSCSMLSTKESEHETFVSFGVLLFFLEYLFIEAFE